MFGGAGLGGGEMWSRAYQLGSTLKTNEKGSYYIFTVATLGTSDEAERSQAEAWWTMFSEKASELKVHEEEADLGGVEA